MKEELISIIVPVYNVELYLERCLKSIINQAYNNWELILVNDGSTDCSGQICQNYAAADKRIIYLKQHNQGQAVARNKALEIAKGKYICFVDSDDWVDSNYLKCLYEAIEKNDSDVAMCAYAIIGNGKKIVKYVPTDKETFKVDEFKSKLIRDEIYSFLVDKIFKKEIINGNRFSPGIYYEDYCFYHKLLPKIKKDVPIVNKPLYFYFQRESSTTHTRAYKNVLDYFNAHKNRFELDYISVEDKVYCLKWLLLAYVRFLQIDKCNEFIRYNCKKYIISTDKGIFVKAKKILPLKLLIYFLLAFHFPALFRFIFKLYKTVINLTENFKKII